MQLFSLSLSVLTALHSVFAVPTTLHTIEKYAGETTGRHLIQLKPGFDKTSLVQQMKKAGNVTHEWQSINGFAGYFDDATLNILRASPDVELISEDGIVHTQMATQTNAPWGISRLSATTKLANQNTSALTFTYEYDQSAGAGVDIYILDTGIYTAHTQFGGRARWGATFGGYADADGYGHGTHCAGVAGGSQFGVAKAANLIAVKVLGDTGGGATSDIMSGANWILQQFQSSGRPAVASMSMAGVANTALDNVVVALTSAGVHVTVAAGNEGSDARYDSPAREPSAITVGSMNILDSRSYFSNFGPAVDIFAPGDNIMSAWIGSPTATMLDTGTSMATPHVAGLIAYLIGLHGNMSPSSMSNLVRNVSLQNVLAGINSGTVNILAHNGQ